MRKEKLTYTQPDCELLVVQFEGGILSDSENSSAFGYNGNNDLEGI